MKPSPERIVAAAVVAVAVTVADAAAVVVVVVVTAAVAAEIATTIVTSANLAGKTFSHGLHGQPAHFVRVIRGSLIYAPQA